MVYVTHMNDSIQTLKKLEGFIGSDEEYKKKLFSENPSLQRFMQNDSISPNTLVLLNEDSPHPQELIQFVSEVNSSSKEVKERLALFQTNNLDIPTLVATHEIMEEVQEYSNKFQENTNQEFISNPWKNSLFDKDNQDFIEKLLESINGISGIAAGIVYRRNHIYSLDLLYDAMIQRDVLSRKIFILENELKKTINPYQKTRIHQAIRNLENEVKRYTKEIKELLPKRIDEKLNKFLTNKGISVYKARSNAYCEKMARKGSSTTLGLNFLAKSGLEKAKNFMQSLAKIGSWAEKGSLFIGPAFVALNVYQAYETKKEWGKVLLSGTAGFAAGFGLGMMGSTASWGAISIGFLAGDAAIGGIILASSPVWGTALCIAVGFAVVGYATYKVQGCVEDLLDTETGKAVRGKTSDALDRACKWFRDLWTYEPQSDIYDRYGLIAIPRPYPHLQKML